MSQQRKPFTADDVRKHGRLKRGAILGGPEPYGCINSGFRPSLAHVNCPTELWTVGPEMRAEEVRKVLKQYEARDQFGLADKRQKAFLRKRIHRVPNDPAGTRTVFVFRSKGAAIEKFVELCNVILDNNAKDRAQHQQALDDMRSPDPERRVRGALASMDY